MRAIQSTTWGQPPTFTSSASDPGEPTATQIPLTVVASGLHRLVRSQALGQHYSAVNAGLPYTPGADGVGKTPDGKLVYFANIATAGGFAEKVNVEKRAIVELSEGADPVQVAGLVNPGMASWMALKTRTVGVVGREGGWSCVVLGVTSQSGKVAVSFARKLGATRVVGVARDEKKMQSLGLDGYVVLKEKAEESDWGKLGDVDVVLDYLYGAAAPACLGALNNKVPTQYVQIGSMAGLETTFPSALFRSKNITIRGSGPGSWTMQEFAKEVEGLVRAVEGLEKQDIKERKLEEIDEAWKNERERTVFVP
jgi:NADPH:quinone reductase-like Zn-dependent oxidoreductase